MTAPATVLPFSLRAGAVVAGRFRLLACIGEGGMGYVWAAEQMPLQRKVALKLLNLDAARRPDAAARFELEARALSRLDDLHVVRVLDFGWDPQAGFFLATEHLEGETLEAVLARQKTLPVDQAVDIAAQALDGLQAAHSAGIVHRDLKPANVMLVRRPDGRHLVKLIDFGIAKVFEQGGPVHLTEAGAVFGTPQYISPEQALCRPVDLRADLYSCGVILFRTLSGQLPFDDPDPGTLAMKHVSEPVPSLPSAMVAPALAAIVRRAMSKDPQARDESARAMRDALLAAAATAQEALAPASHSTVRMAGTRLAAGAVSVVRTILAVQVTDVPTAATPGIDPVPALPTGAPVTPTLRLSVAVPRTGPIGLARNVVESFGGSVVRLSGNGLVAQIASPTDALLCAAAIQDRFTAESTRRGWTSALHVAVDAGEVTVDDSVQGGAIERAAALATRAEGAEVLFTRSVYLAMARSEIACEPVDGQERNLFRLRPSGAVWRPELPFGGGTLERTKGRRLDRLLRAAARASSSVAIAGVDVFGRVLLRLGRKLVAAMSEKPAVAAVVLLAIAAALGAALHLKAERPDEVVRAAMQQGRLELARARAERWTRESGNDGDAHAWLARVLAARGERVATVTELYLALDRKPELAADPEIARVLRACLSGPSGRTAQGLALLHPTPAVTAMLHEAALAEDDGAAAMAIEAIRELGGQAQLLAALAQELEPVTDCAAARRAVGRLSALGDAGGLAVLERVALGLEGGQDPCGLGKPVRKVLKGLHK